MAAKYAKDQAAGFANRISKVAIVGASGQIGSPIVKSLLATGNHTVTAITREDSPNTFPEGVKVAKVNYDNEESLISALRGQQFFIITMRVTAPRDSQAKLIAAAAKAGVPYVTPNGYGCDFTNEKLSTENYTGAGVKAAIKDIESHGVSKWISLICGFWYEYSLSMGPGWYGLDFKNKKVSFIDDGKTAINTTTWVQCGRAMASLLSLPILPEDENDKQPTISQWDNKPVKISDFLVSQRDMLDSANRVLGTTDADWTIEYEDHDARYKRSQVIMASEDRLLGFGMGMYTRTFFPNGGGNYQDTKGLDNEVLGLTPEDLDAATKRGIDMALVDYNPFARP